MDKLKFINEQMDIIAVPYELNEWTQAVSYPYYVGEFTEDEPTTEDGAEQSTLILTGFYRGEQTTILEENKDKIKKHFRDLRASTDNGSIVVEYGGAFSIPSGEIGLEKMQIMLKIKEWKGDW
jgi:hypothetical protein